MGTRAGRSADGTVVVVTGAGRGLGAALATRLAARGARVALLDRDAEPLGEVARRCGPGSRAWTADVTDAARLAEVATQIADHFGRVDMVVANAGIGGGDTLLHGDAADHERILEVNLHGSIRTARAFLPHLVTSRGHLLQIASLAAMTPAPLMTAYAASKAGVEAFAHALRPEVAHHGVTVGVAYFAFTDTDMVRGVDEVEPLRALRAGMPGPFGRTFPLDPAADRLVDGLLRRSPHVYGQRWLRVLPAVRGALPSLIAVGARHQRGPGGIAEAERQLAAAPPPHPGAHA